jgi:quercetin 2,3-dioxygenase
VWDIRLAGEQQIRIPVPKGYTTVLAVLKGSVRRGGPDIDGNDPGSGNGGGGDRDVITVPEPTTLALIGFGIASMSTVRRRRK